MPTYDSLSEGLSLLYDYSARFRVSLDLVQKLAKHLKLDTFVDTEVHDAPSIQRLSIAGSLLLVDIDFAERVTKVALSLGNHTLADVTLVRQIDPKVHAQSYTVSKTEDGTTTVVGVDFGKSNLSFLKTRDGSVSVAESILLANLSGETLGNFSANLKYLASLDSISPPEGDLVVYLDNIALYLTALHAVEIETLPNWEVEAGWTNRCGRVMLNDTEAKLLGVIINFWHDTRTLNHAQPAQPFGKLYSGVLSVEEASALPIDYLKEAASETWELEQPDGGFKNYKFTFDGDLHLHNQQSVTSGAGRNWKLVFRVNHPVYMPKSVLDFLGVTDYEAAKGPLDDVYALLTENGDIEFTQKNEDTVTSQICVELHDRTPYVAVTAITLPKLSLLSLLVPALRNHIVLSSLVQGLHENKEYTLSSRATTELNETNKKLKQSLKLSNEVTEEELIGLNTLSGASEYLGLQMLNTDSELDTFMKDEDVVEEVESKEQSVEPLQHDRLTFSIDDIAYNSPDTELHISVEGQLQEPISGDFTIKNGVIRQTGDVAMDGATSRYIRALSLSEDILLAIQT